MDDVLSLIEDIISEYQDSPNLLRELKKNIRPGEYNPSVHGDPFGDDKLGKIVYDALNGKPLDLGYIKSIGKIPSRDFSEIETKGNSVFVNLDSEGYNELNFKKLLVSPMLVTDWQNHKHEFVGSFDFDMVPAEEVASTGKMCNLADQVSVALINLVSAEHNLPSVPAGLTDSELLDYFEDNPSDYMDAIAEFDSFRGPTLEDLCNSFERVMGTGKTILAEDVVYTLTNPENDDDDFIRARYELDHIDETDGDFGIKAVIRSFINKFKSGTTKYKNESKKQYAELKKATRSDLSELVLDKALANEIPVGTDVEPLLHGKHKCIYAQHKYAMEHPCYKNFPTDFYNMRLSGLPVPEADPYTEEKLRELLDENFTYVKPVGVGEATSIIVTSSKPVSETLNDLEPRMKPGDFFQVYKNFNEEANRVAEQALSKVSSPDSVPPILEKKSREIPMGERDDRDPNHRTDPEWGKK